MWMQIKIRAWVCEPNNVRKGQMYYQGDVAIGFINNEWFFDGDCIGEAGEQNGFIPMVWTGLYDRNGNEIYEGDILLVDLSDEMDRRMYVVQNFISDIVKITTQFSVSDIGVFGNIYENPELVCPMGIVESVKHAEE
jgi:hypothetical protein